MLASVFSIVIEMNMFLVPVHDSIPALLDNVKELIQERHLDSASRLLTLSERAILEADAGSRTRYYLYRGDIEHGGSLKAAVSFYSEGISVGRKQKELVLVAQLLDRLGREYRDEGDFSSAKKYYLEALFLRDSLQNVDGIATSNEAMGILHSMMKEHSIALKYFSKAHEQYLKAGTTVKLARSYNNIGLANMELESYPDALENLKKSLTLKYKESFSRSDISNTLNNLGLVFEHLDMNDSAISYHLKCIDIRKNLNLKEGLATSYNNLGYVYATKAEWRNALRWYSLSLPIADSLKLRLLKRKLYSNISRAYYETGDLKLAYTNLYNYDLLNDSIFNETKTRQISELQTKYETEKKEQQILMQQTEIDRRTTERDNIMLILVFAIISSAVLVYFYRQRQLVQRTLRENEKEIYNRKINEMLKDRQIETMAAMLNGQERERKRIAADLHDRLGSSLSAIKLLFSATGEKTTIPHVQKIGQLIDETVDEVRKISHDLASGVIKQFGLVAALKDLKSTLEESQKLKVELSISNLPERLDNEIEISIYRIIQELISNILKHAQATEVAIQLTRIGNELNVLVDDNGIGFKTQDISSNGLGLENIKNRVRSLSGTINIDSTIKRGTIINIMMPI
jgi:two-component system, NarL family, sensor kinase